MRKSFIVLMLLGMGLVGCTFQKAQLTSEIQSELDRFNGNHQPLQDFFREAEYSQLKISPDGRFIAALYPRNGVNSIGILSSDLKGLLFTGQFDDERHILDYEWVNNTRLILRAGKKYGYLDGRDWDVQTFFVDYNGRNFKNFFAKQRASYHLVRILPNDPDHVVMARYHWSDRGRPTAVKVNVNNGQEKKLASPPIERGFFLADEQGEVNVALEVSDESFDESQIHYRLGRGTKWEKLQYPVKGKGHLKPLHLDSKSKVLYLTSSLETGREGVYRLDLTTGQSKLISGDPKVDVTGFVMDRGDRLVGVIYDPDYPEVEMIDPNAEVMKLYRDLLISFKHQRVDGVSLTYDQSVGIFRISSDKNPGEFYKIDVKSRQVTFLGRSRSWLKPENLAAMKPVQFKARDGLDIHGYLTLPPKGPQKNLPAVLVVHGGPHGVRDFWGYDPEVQFLAERGFAVLQVNYRGSGGYGTKFLESGYKQWGLKMQDDLTDATHWLVKEGYADPKRLAIYGGSYGGYAALMGAVREPDLYRCAVTYVGVSYLTIQRSDSDTANFDAGEDYMDRALGTDEDDLKKRSALYNIDQIKVPIFIAHGKDDRRVPFSNAEELRKALEKAGKPFEWMAKDSEGHGFSQDANRYEFYLRLAQFLEKHTATPTRAAGN
ncbi:alpha/beta hydrolase family protein [Oligoflexus tunisiensis]|uniref:alpha/beta hydrolase family protein n=1 Tax=Oligoflexus tunisiensis TaxID=708132 RepID=UPI000B2AEF3F|nr:S9 family peptidase [Oligoflexus tunisiensis]